MLIHAAGGGVGTALLQLGKLLNLQMYGTASARKHDIVREFDGIPIDYRNQDFLEYIRKEIPDIGARVPLVEVQRAHRLMEAGSVSGKVVLLSEA